MCRSPTSTIPASRIVANIVATIVFQLVFGQVAYRVLALAPGRGNGHMVDPAGYRIARTGRDRPSSGIRHAQAASTGRGRMDLSAQKMGSTISGLMYTHERWEWRNAGVRWQSTTVGFPWWPLVAAFVARPLFRALCRFDLKPALLPKPCKTPQDMAAREITGICGSVRLRRAPAPRRIDARNAGRFAGEHPLDDPIFNSYSISTIQWSGNPVPGRVESQLAARVPLS